MSEAEQAVDSGLGGDVSTPEGQVETSQTSLTELPTEELEQTDEPQEGDEESQQSEEDFEEVEFNGKQYRIPAELKDAFMLREMATRKTQEVAAEKATLAEERAAFEQQRALVAQSLQRQQANQEAHANLAALDMQLKQYQNVDWNQFIDSDQTAAQKEFFKYNQLREQREQLAGYIQQQDQASMQERNVLKAQQIEQAERVLVKEIPGWSPQLSKEISDSALEIGITNAELQEILDPRYIKALYYAKIGLEAVKKAKTVKPVQQQPAKTIKPSTAANPKDPERLSDSEWYEQHYGKKINKR